MKNVLNLSEWAQSGVYPFDRAISWRVHKVDIAAGDPALAAAEPLTSPIKLSALLKVLNANAVGALTTALATELSHEYIYVEATSF